MALKFVFLLCSSSLEPVWLQFCLAWDPLNIRLKCSTNPVSASQGCWQPRQMYISLKEEGIKRAVVFRLLTKSICCWSAFIFLIKLAARAQKWLPLCISYSCPRGSAHKSVRERILSQNWLSPPLNFQQPFKSFWKNCRSKKNKWHAGDDRRALRLWCDYFSHALIFHAD